MFFLKLIDNRALLFLRRWSRRKDDQEPEITMRGSRWMDGTSNLSVANAVENVI